MNKYLNFERDLLDHEIKNCKKTSFCYFSSSILSLLLIAINIPIIYHDPTRLINTIIIGCAAFNALDWIAHWFMNRLELKELIRRKGIYAEFDVRERLKFTADIQSTKNANDRKGDFINKDNNIRPL